MRSAADTLKLIASGAFLIGGLLYLGTNVAFYTFADRIMRSEREYSNPKDPFRGRNLTITEQHEQDGKRFKRGYLEMAKFGDIKAGRMASFSAYVRVNDLLKPGEAAPAREMLPVFAKSRAILFAQEECERLMQTLARDCAVNSAQGRIDDGIVRIDGSLRFVQRDEFGELDPEAEWVFANVSDTLTTPTQTSSMGAGASDRLAVYRKAAQKCAEIKRRESNCAITSVRAFMSKSRSGYRIDGLAEFAFLVKQRG